MVSFKIPGEPKGKGRPRFSRAGNFVRTYTPEATASYENLVKVEYERQCGNQRFEDEDNLCIDITAYFKIPKSTSKKKIVAMMSGGIRPTKKPDMDNIIKIICDALNNIAYHDDKQIVAVVAKKYYTNTDAFVNVFITKI